MKPSVKTFNLTDESPALLEQVIVGMVSDLAAALQQTHRDLNPDQATIMATDRLRLHLDQVHGRTPESPYGVGTEG